MAPRRVQIAVAAVMAVLLAGLIALPFLPQAVAGSGPYSVYTAARLEERSAAKHDALLVPAALPAGEVSPQGSDLLARRRHRLPAPRLGLDLYGFGTRFEVFQRRAPDQTEPCGASGSSLVRIERDVDHHHVTVCSRAFTPEARAYWSGVTWTSDYGNVDWLVPGE